jgi:acetylornithine/succinyldiaminopimelate/putrescine aminotransferase
VAENVAAILNPADSYLLQRELYKRYPVTVRGEGCWLCDSAGQKYLTPAGAGREDTDGS